MPTLVLPHRCRISAIGVLILLFLALTPRVIRAGEPDQTNKTVRLKGVICDASDQSPLIGATLYIDALGTGAVTDVDGAFVLDLPAGRYTARVQYVGYVTQEIEINSASLTPQGLVIALQPESETLGTVTVAAKAKQNTDIALLRSIRKSVTVADGISAQQIRRTADGDAAQVIKRIPGVTLMGSRYVMVRGLNQRFNNVWLNGAPLPGAEPDSRVFSFDIVPGAQLDNILVVKNPVAELPADYSGGFILISTKDIPQSNLFTLNLKGGANAQTHFRPFSYNHQGFADYLGLGAPARAMASWMPAMLPQDDPQLLSQVAQSGFNNHWAISTLRPWTDISLQSTLSRVFYPGGQSRLGLLAALNYNNDYQTIDSMANNRFGLWNVRDDQPEFINLYTDTQFTLKNRLGGLLNIGFTSGPSFNIALKNTLNLIALNRYTLRDGFQNQSQLYKQHKREYLYNSRLIYTAQLIGAYFFDPLTDHKLEWTLGYAYSNNHRPDRRIINLEQNDVLDDPHYGRMRLTPAQITREFSSLNEHILSLNTLYQLPIALPDPNQSLLFKAGTHAELTRRSYDNRQFYYIWADNPALPSDFPYMDPLSLLVPQNMGYDKLYLLERLRKDNSYRGANYKGAAFLSGQYTLGALTLYAGVRYEFNRMQLINYSQAGYSYLTSVENHDDSYFYPSLNLSYRLAPAHQLRLAYGLSTNRPEFRELSKTAYYDFDLFSWVQGNRLLKRTLVQNLDLKWEFYPGGTDLIAASVFYKHFTHPIEWSYRSSGGSYVYYFDNARSARNFGVEVEVRKRLDFITVLKDLTLNLNAAYINSRLHFDREQQEPDRPMQGQSPYIINASLYYENPDIDLLLGLTYNRIGKRIVGVGQRSSSESGGMNNNIPDSYEMPRNQLDFVAGWKFTKHWELKATAANILNSRVTYKQFPSYMGADGVVHQREQTTKQFVSGAAFTLGLTYTL